MRFKLFHYSKVTGEFLGCQSPAILSFASKEEGETVADRYRARCPNSDFRVQQVDERGYIIPETTEA